MIAAQIQINYSNIALLHFYIIALVIFCIIAALLYRCI